MPMLFNFVARDRVLLLLMLALTMVLIGPAGTPTHAAEPSPAAADPDRLNVLFIAVDDLKPAIGAFGDPHAVTPHLDALARRGTVFLNAHCQQAVCAPSRVSLLTGLRPDTTRVRDLQTRFRDHLPDVVTLPQRFKQAGYHSVGIGKIFDHRSVEDRATMDAVSWSEPYLEAPSPADETFGYRNPQTIERIAQRRRQLAPLPDDWVAQVKAVFAPHGMPPTDRADVPDDAYGDGAMTDVAVEQLQQLAQRDQPFFFAVGYHKPHLPFNAPEKYWALHDPADLPLAQQSEGPLGAPDYAPQHGWELRAMYAAPKEGPIPVDQQRQLVHGYYAAISYVDAQIGRLLQQLDDLQLAGSTLVVVWGDHGWHLGDHGMWCKHTNYEQATRSPLLIYTPAFDHAGGRVSAPVEFVDLYPTLLDLAGVEPTSDPALSLAGLTLRPLLNDPEAEVKTVAVSQFPRRTDDATYEGYTFRTRRFRYTQWRDMDLRVSEALGPVVDEEFYDYQADPDETRNHLHDPALADELQQLRAAAEAYFADRP